ncbi:ATP synthase F0 subunit 8 (mitochondrion) [Notothenia coriiceps]|uniref:ATP synthase F0 subunit 8 n=1 Tax=Notothenia coriiceps TaxID=8208 RepID=F8UWF5_9TELE|nr:ATP synthase F0 subunit 8 [Notothenia coriiceps]AEH05442.1 ATP synthase F0 subunit 8 [Notothenia coriiceps]BBC27482.1 ATPase subunit 8 [Notothenia coriiceps]
MPVNYHTSCFTMLALSLFLYFTMGHAKIVGHATTLKPSPWPAKFLTEQKWSWPWS